MSILNNYIILGYLFYIVLSKFKEYFKKIHIYILPKTIYILLRNKEVI